MLSCLLMLRVALFLLIHSHAGKNTFQQLNFANFIPNFFHHKFKKQKQDNHAKKRDT